MLGSYYCGLIALSVLMSIHSIKGHRLKPTATYFIAAPKSIRAAEAVQIYVSLFHVQYSSVLISAVITRENINVVSSSHRFYHPATKLLTLQVPDNAVVGNYSLVVYGKVHSAYLFYNETRLNFQTKHVSVFIQTDHMLYGRAATLYFRVVAMTPELTPVLSGSITVLVKDANDHVVKRFLSQNLYNGFYENSVGTAHPRKYGWWTVEVHGWGHVYKEKVFTNNFHANKFNVNASIPSYIMDNEYGLEGVITSNYTSGFPVRGNMSIQVELERDHFKPQPLIHNISMFTGVASFLVPMKDIENALGGKRNLSGTNIKTTVTCYDWYAQESRLRLPVIKSHIYSSALKMIYVGGKVRVFKPNQAFPIVLAFYLEDGSCYSNFNFRNVKIDVLVKNANQNIIRMHEIQKVIPDTCVVYAEYMPKKTDQFIVVRAYVVDYKTSYGEMTAYRHQTREHHFLSLTSSTHNPRANTYMVFTVKSDVYIPKIFYMVMSKSNILFQDILEMNNMQTTFSVSLASKMMPMSTVIVYGVLNSGEILADSLKFFVKGLRKDKFSVRINRGKDLRRDSVELNLSGDPTSLVVVSAWPYELYRMGLNPFLNEHKIERELMTYNSFEEPHFEHRFYDSENQPFTLYYNTPSFAVDANSTFFLSGLYVFTDADLYRIPDYEKCNVSEGYRSCYDGSCYMSYQQCDGKRDCQDGADELNCETDIGIVRPDVMKELFFEDFLIDSTVWGWIKSYTQPFGRRDLAVAVPFRPRTWMLSGYSISPQTGIAFQQEPARMMNERSFYIKLEQEKIAKKGEQLGMQVTVFNYWHQPLEAVITLVGSDQYRFINVEEFGIVSSYNPRTTAGDVQTMIYLRPNEVRLLHFPVLPVVMGKVTVTVTAQSIIGSYVVKHVITIVPDGITTTYHTPYLIDLVNTGSVLIPDLAIPVPERFSVPEQRELLYVPGSQAATISIIGDIYGPGYFTASPDIYNTFGYIYGDMEQVAYKIKNNMLNLKYLKLTNQLPDDALISRLKDIAKTVQYLAAYVSDDGSVRMYRRSPLPDIWSSAIALDTFSSLFVPEWEEHLYLDLLMTEKITSWIVSKQNSDGSFYPNTYVYDMRLRSNVTDSEGRLLYLSYTAAVTIALQASTQVITGDAASGAFSSVKKSADYLASHVHMIENPFEMCIVTYALYVANHNTAPGAFVRMNLIARRGEFVYWSENEIPGNPREILNTRLYLHPRTLPLPWSSQAVQATAYALLVTLRNNRFQDAQPIMMWLHTQRDADGGFISSIDTVTANMALLEYSRRNTNRALYNMAVTVESTSSPNWRHKVALNSDHLNTYTTLSVPVVYGAVRAAAQGSGMALLQMTSTVNVEHEWQLRKPAVQSFDLRLEELTFWGRNLSHFKAKVCARWLHTSLSPTSGDVTLEVDVPTGFFVRKDVLRGLQRQSRIHVMRSRWAKHKVVNYMEYLDEQGDCWNFYAERRYPVANTTIRHLIKIYDNKEPGLQNTTIYTTYGLFHLHICQSCGSFQCPYCPYYNSANCINNNCYMTISYLFSIYILILFYYKGD